MSPKINKSKIKRKCKRIVPLKKLSKMEKENIQKKITLRVSFMEREIAKIDFKIQKGEKVSDKQKEIRRNLIDSRNSLIKIFKDLKRKKIYDISVLKEKKLM